MDLRIEVEGEGQARTVLVEGSCDLASAAQLREQLKDLSPPTATDVVLDVSKVDFIDSTGLGVVLGALRDQREGGGELKMRGAQGPVLRVLQITGLDKVIPLV